MNQTGIPFSEFCDNNKNSVIIVTRLNDVSNKIEEGRHIGAYRVELITKLDISNVDLTTEYKFDRFVRVNKNKIFVNDYYVSRDFFC